MPLFLVKHFFFVDLKAMFFGVKQEDEQVHHSKSPSFLVRRGSSEDYDKLPIQRKGTLIQISQDIAADRAAVRSTLARAATETAEEAKMVLKRTYTMKSGDEEEASKPANAYSAATQAALSHHIARRGSLRDMSDIDLKATTKKAEKPKKASNEDIMERRTSAVGA